MARAWADPKDTDSSPCRALLSPQWCQRLTFLSVAQALKVQFLVEELLCMLGASAPAGAVTIGTIVAVVTVMNIALLK